MLEYEQRWKLPTRSVHLREREVHCTAPSPLDTL